MSNSLDISRYLLENLMNMIKSLDTKRVQLVALSLLKRHGINYENKYSPPMNTITFQFLISLAIS